jgi:hypothetical protein
MQLELLPPDRVGPIMIGMDFDEAEVMLRALPGFQSPGPGERRQPGFAHYESEMSIAVYSERDLVKAVEVFRPEGDDVVLYRGISIFKESAGDVIRELQSITRVHVERDGLFVVAPDLLLALSRPYLPESPEDEEGRYFESVLIAAPGYYSGPEGPIY